MQRSKSSGRSDDNEDSLHKRFVAKFLTFDALNILPCISLPRI